MSSERFSGAKGAVKKKIELSQEEIEKQRRNSTGNFNFSQKEINKIIGFEDKKGKKSLINMEQKTSLINSKEIQGGLSMINQNFTSTCNPERSNSENENVFTPKKSISRTPTKSDAQNSGNASNNKRLRSELSPEVMSTKRQCEGTDNNNENVVTQNSPSDVVQTELTKTEVQIPDIILALEKIDKIMRQEESGSRTGFIKTVQDNVRDKLSFVNRNLTLLVYKLGSLEKENLMLKYKLENRICKEPTQEILESNTELNKSRKIIQKTYANILNSTGTKSQSTAEKIEEWTTPKTTKKHETIIRVDQIKDSRIAIQELRKEIDTKSTDGGFKNIKALSNGAVLVESHNKSQQEKLKTLLQNKKHITVKEPQGSSPMFVMTGVEKGFKDIEVIEELFRLNGDIQDELGLDVEHQIKIIARKQCRNPTKENLILQAPPVIAKWFLKKQIINFDLVKVHVKEYFNLAICFKCCGFGHVAKYCSGKECCHKCGGEHFGRDCSEIEWKCPNCEKMKFGVLQHSARDINCPVYKRRIERFKQNINYSDTLL